MRPRSLLLALAAIAVAHPAAAGDLQAVATSASAVVAPRGDGAISRSGIGGVVFTIQSTGGSAPLRGAAFLGTQFVAVGDGGRIVRSSDGGLGWNAESAPVTNHLRAITAHANQYWIAVGDAGVTLRATGTSTTWDSTLSPGGKILRGVASNGLTPGILVAVGDDGTVLRSTDQGLTWTRQTLAGAPDLRAVTVGASSSHFIAVGLGGVIVRSTNSGLGWTPLGSPVSNDLYAVAIDATNRFVAVGAAGTVLRSIGGADGTWQQQSFPVAQTLRGVRHDGTAFYAVGDAEVIARSPDGVAWFQVEVTPTSWTDVKGRFR